MVSFSGIRNTCLTSSRDRIMRFILSPETTKGKKKKKGKKYKRKKKEQIVETKIFMSLYNSSHSTVIPVRKNKKLSLLLCDFPGTDT